MSEPDSPVGPSLYKFIVEQARDYAVFALDPAGYVLTWNLGAQLIKGYLPNEIIGQHFSKFYTRDAVDSGWPDRELKNATAEGRFEDEGWRVRKDGSRFWASVIITALREEDGHLVGFSKITRDLSGRKKDEEVLRQSEERFRLLVEGVVDYAIYMLDPEGIISSWNVGAETIKGYSRGEIIGKHFSRFYTQEDVDAGKPWMELAQARRVGRAEDEGWRVRKNGERFWARVVISALHDANGNLRGFAKVTQDISTRRHVQDLEVAAKNVHEFIAVLAHELRNPLAPIRTAVHAMAMLPAGSADYDTLRETIDRQSAHMARLIDDLIDISRITTGNIALERQPVNMVDAVRRAIETSAPLVDSAGHMLNVDVPDAALMVRGDVLRLTQLLTNIVNNAARYTPAGGEIDVRARAEGTFAVVSVRDNGQGIAPHLMEGIFQMFVQGVSSLERLSGGLGIGLALARKLAELHEVFIEGHSAGPGLGSEFTVRIPLLPQSATRSPRVDAPAAAPKRSVNPLRILVVDDNVDAAIALDMLLKVMGHESRVAHDGMVVMEMIAGYRPDVVLLDIGLPVMDGYEVARRLQSLKKERPFCLVAVTGWGQDTDKQKSREAGFDLHLVKPVGLEELARVLEGVSPEN
jgi:PAS domain S-box-containing protein